MCHGEMRQNQIFDFLLVGFIVAKTSCDIIGETGANDRVVAAFPFADIMKQKGEGEPVHFFDF